jgi:hypothetical protein
MSPLSAVALAALAATSLAAPLPVPVPGADTNLAADLAAATAPAATLPPGYVIASASYANANPAPSPSPAALAATPPDPALADSRPAAGIPPSAGADSEKVGILAKLEMECEAAKKKGMHKEACHHYGGKTGLPDKWRLPTKGGKKEAAE